MVQAGALEVFTDARCGSDEGRSGDYRHGLGEVFEGAAVVTADLGSGAEMGEGIHVQETVLCIKKKAGDFPGLFLRGYPVATLTILRKVAKVSTVEGFVKPEKCYIWKAVNFPQTR